MLEIPKAPPPIPGDSPERKRWEAKKRRPPPIPSESPKEKELKAPKTEIRQTKKESRAEGLENREALRKVVDIYSEEDLKYKNISGYKELVPVLEIGVTTPRTDFLHDPIPTGNVKEQLSDIRRKIKERDIERESSEVEGRGKYGGEGQVYYPEGILKAVKDHLLGTQEVEYYRTDLEARKPFEASILKRGQNILKQLVIENDDNFDEFGIEGGGLISEKKVYTQIFSDPQKWEILRKKWIEYFFSNDQDTSWRACLQDSAYQLRFGVIIDPKVKVGLSYHGDFPTEATILDTRAKPKDIKGIIINPDRIVSHDNSDAIKPSRNLKRQFGHVMADNLSFMKESEYTLPEEPLFTLIDTDSLFGRPITRITSRFIAHLQKKGFSKEELEDAVNKIKEVDSEVRDSIYKKKTVQEHQKSTELRARIKEALGDKLVRRLNEKAGEFIKENIPIKEGDTLWQGVIEIAKKYQVPIYSTRGDLLWPKEMSNKKLKEFVGDRKKQ